MVVIIIAVVIIFIIAVGASEDTRPQSQKDYEEGYKAGLYCGPYNPDNEDYLQGYIAGEYDREHE